MGKRKMKNTTQAERLNNNRYIIETYKGVNPPFIYIIGIILTIIASILYIDRIINNTIIGVFIVALIFLFSIIVKYNKFYSVYTFIPISTWVILLVLSFKSNTKDMLLTALKYIHILTPFMLIALLVYILIRIIRAIIHKITNKNPL